MSLSLSFGSIGLGASRCSWSARGPAFGALLSGGTPLFSLLATVQQFERLNALERFDTLY